MRASTERYAPASPARRSAKVGPADRSSALVAAEETAATTAQSESQAIALPPTPRARRVADALLLQVSAPTRPPPYAKQRADAENLCLDILLHDGEAPPSPPGEVRERAAAALAREQLDEARARAERACAESAARATGPAVVAGALCSARDFSIRFENRLATRPFANEARLAALQGIGG